MVLLVLFLAYVLKQTAWGRHVYAVGDDPEAAELSGVHVKRTLISVYMLSGLICAFAGWALIGRIGSVSPTSGQLGNIESITAVVIGGISLFGGRGSIMGMLFGALIVGVFSLGLGCSAPTRNGPTCSSACSSSPPSPSTSGSERCSLMEPILKGRNLVKRYGKRHALDNCDFDLHAGRDSGRHRRQRRRQVDADQGDLRCGDAPTTGKIWLEGKEVKFHSPHRCARGRHRNRLPDARHVAGPVDRRQHVHGPRNPQAGLHGQVGAAPARPARRWRNSPATSSMNSA
jgi:hypothetical protein